VLRYDANAQVGGKLAQIGARLVDGAAKKIADQFFANFAAHVGGSAEPVAETAADAAPEAAPAVTVNHETTTPSKSVSTATWIVGLIVVVAILLVLFSVL